MLTAIGLGKGDFSIERLYTLFVFHLLRRQFLEQFLCLAGGVNLGKAGINIVSRFFASGSKQKNIAELHIGRNLRLVKLFSNLVINCMPGTEHPFFYLTSEVTLQQVLMPQFLPGKVFKSGYGGFVLNFLA